MLKSTTLLFVLLLLLSGSRCTSGKEGVEPVKESNSFEGKWDNDFLLCGYENIGKSGVGSLAKRKKEELLLTFEDGSKGHFSFYSCLGNKRFDGVVPFAYTLNGNGITLEWQGTAKVIRVYKAAFNIQDTYQLECRNDTLFFRDEFMKHTIYSGATYFVRRQNVGHVNPTIS